MKKITGLLILLLLNSQAYSSHLMGGEITWKTDSLNRFTFKVKLYRDCNGISGPSTIALYSNSPVSNIPCNPISITDLSPVGINCPSCDSTDSLRNAVQEYIFESAPIILTGTPPPGGWYFSYVDCCRNANIVNLTPPQGSFTLRAIMFGDGPGGTITGTDDSPQFLLSPTIGICPGELVEYSHSAYDPELDSLSYEWGNPLSSSYPNPALYPFMPGYSYQSPLPDSTMNPGNIPAVLDNIDGGLTFRAYNPGSYVTVIKVSSWKCGVKTAEIYRELQVSVMSNCIISTNPTILNTAPQLEISKFPSLTPIQRDTVQAGDHVSYLVLGVENQMDSAGTAFQGLELSCYSPHFGNNYTDSLQGCIIAPCATLTQPGIQTGSFSLSNILNFYTACSHASFIDGCLQHMRSYAFTFKAKDDFCPVNGLRFRTVNLMVSGPEVKTSGTNLYVSAQPGSSIQWYLNGVPVPGATDSILIPTQNGIYSVISTTPGGCQLISNTLPRGVTSANEIKGNSLQNIYVDETKNINIILNSLSNGPANIQIINVEGKLVRSFSVDLSAGLQHLLFETTGITDGIYMVQLVMNGSQTSKKVLLTH